MTQIEKVWYEGRFWIRAADGQTTRIRIRGEVDQFSIDSDGPPIDSEAAVRAYRPTDTQHTTTVRHHGDWKMVRGAPEGFR